MVHSHSLSRNARDEITYTIRCSEHTEQGKTYICTLFCNGQIGDFFRISVTCGDESADAFFKARFSEAALLFERISQGSVPPYIFAEILEDFEKERE